MFFDKTYLHRQYHTRMGGDNVATSLSLMRRLPPAKIEQNLSGLLNLLPEDQEELLQRIDQPLEVATDADVSTVRLQIDN